MFIEKCGFKIYCVEMEKQRVLHFEKNTFKFLYLNKCKLGIKIYTIISILIIIKENIIMYFVSDIHRDLLIVQLKCLHSIIITI